MESSKDNPETSLVSKNRNSFVFPTKPTFSRIGRQIDIATNYFKFEFLNNNTKSFFKYAVEFQPELPGDAMKLRRSIFGSAREQITEKLGHTIFNNTTVYSKENIKEKLSFVTVYKETQYQIEINWANIVDLNSMEALGLYRRFFSSLIQKLKFVPMKRNYFNPKMAKVMNEYSIELWPGFSPTIAILDKGILLNLSIINRVLRNETAWDVLQQIQRNFRNDNQEYRQAVEDAFKGTMVITRYNNEKTYVVDSVDFNKNPLSTFSTKNGEVSYEQYYKEKYGKVVNKDQPLLINKDKQGNIIHLIPQLCYLSGLTDNMRNNFNLMKAIAESTKGSAREKVNENVKLLDTIMSNGECRKEIEKWGMKINTTPLMLEGRVISAGNILMARKQDNNRCSICVDNLQGNDLDRQIQQEMYSQVPLSNWAILCCDRDNETAVTFKTTLDQVLNTFRYKTSEIKKIGVKSNNYRDWEMAIKNNLNPSVQAVILLIPGSRGKGPLYKDLKKLLLTECPIPSQVVLVGTISKGKGIRSIVNKVVMQIAAKVGGEPWAIDNLPFTNVPTMICGIDTYGKPGSKTEMLAFCGTYNRTFTKYVSFLKTPQEESPISAELTDCIKKAIETFGEINKVAPKHIILFRDALSQGSLKDKVAEDISFLKKGVEKLSQQNLDIKFTYVLLSKKVNAKLFFYDKNRNDYDNCTPGTVVDENIVNNELNDFYLISQKSNQGVSMPTHYYLAYDDFKVNPAELYSLIYKMSYLYYNWTGSVRTPAPYMYAKKMIRLIGEKLSDSKLGVVKPSRDFETKFKTLYYL